MWWWWCYQGVWTYLFRCPPQRSSFSAPNLCGVDHRRGSFPGSKVAGRWSHVCRSKASFSFSFTLTHIQIDTNVLFVTLLTFRCAITNNRAASTVPIDVYAIDEEFFDFFVLFVRGRNHSACDVTIMSNAVMDYLRRSQLQNNERSGITNAKYGFIIKRFYFVLENYPLMY